MPTTTNPDQVKSEAQGILRVWTANAEFKLKDVTLASFQSDVQQFETLLKDIADKEEALKPLRNDRDELAAKLNNVCMRARSAIKGYFGDNSSEYELAGGTRTSERKKTGPHAKTATAPAK